MAFLNAKEAADHLGLDYKRFIRLVDAGEIPAFRDPTTHSRVRRYVVASLDEWERNCSTVQLDEDVAS